MECSSVGQFYYAGIGVTSGAASVIELNTCRSGVSR